MSAEKNANSANAEPVVATNAPVAETPASSAADTPRIASASRGKRRLTAVAVLVGLAMVATAIWYFAIRESEPRNDAERFQGEWKLVDARQGENAEDEGFRVAVRVTGEQLQFIHGGGEGKAYRFTLNETTDPRQIDLELLNGPKLIGPAVKMHGVYAFDENKSVRLRVRPGTDPRPKTLEDPDATEWLLTRVKLEAAPKPGSE